MLVLSFAQAIGLYVVPELRYIWKDMVDHVFFSWDIGIIGTVDKVEPWFVDNLDIITMKDVAMSV